MRIASLKLTESNSVNVDQQPMCVDATSFTHVNPFDLRTAHGTIGARVVRPYVC